jgi:two-component system response regulator
MYEKSKGELKETLSRFGSAVRSHRKRLGLSQEDLADRSGLHRTYITDVERGVRNVTMESISRLVRALDVPFTQIFGIMEGKQPGWQLAGEHTTSPERVSVRPVEILLVEGNRKHADGIARSLKQHGVTNRVSVVYSGEAALRRLYDGASPPGSDPPILPDIILLDITLSEINALEVLRRLRADGRTRAIPVVVLIPSGSDQDYSETTKLGVTFSINKPVDFCEFSTLMPKMGFQWVLMDQE